MQIHDLNTKTLTNPAYVAFDDGSDTYKAEFNEVVQAAADTAAQEALENADVSGNTITYTSGDASSPTAWTSVTTLTSGLSLATLFNRISTMVKNVRYIWNKLGTTSMGTTATTITGAIAEHESDISTLNSNLTPTTTRVTQTTDANGNMALGIALTRLVLFADNGQQVFVPFVYNGAWYVRVQQANSGGTAVANTHITCTVYTISIA